MGKNSISHGTYAMIRATRMASASNKKNANASFGFRQYLLSEIADFLGGFADLAAMAFSVVDVPSVHWPAIPLTHTALVREAGRSKSPFLDGLQIGLFTDVDLPSKSQHLSPNTKVTFFLFLFFFRVILKERVDIILVISKITSNIILIIQN